MRKYGGKGRRWWRGLGIDVMPYIEDTFIGSDGKNRSLLAFG